MTTMNELGEFGVPEAFDPDARRATVYASLRATQATKFGNYEQDTELISCRICGKKFASSRYRRKYCSEKCRQEARRRSWRKQWNERKKKKWAK